MDDRLVVLDFETTGLSAWGGDRTIEVGAVVIQDGAVADSFQSLMNPGCRISSFIEDFTGISNTMLASAPPCHEVIPRLHDFVGNSVIVAHNASFDRNFLDAELDRTNRKRAQPFVCSMRVARRLYPAAPNHKLGTLVDYAEVPIRGTFHRALADAEMTALLWLKMMDVLGQKFGIRKIDLRLLQQIEKLAIARAHHWLRDYSQR